MIIEISKSQRRVDTCHERYYRTEFTTVFQTDDLSMVDEHRIDDVIRAMESNNAEDFSMSDVIAVEIKRCRDVYDNGQENTIEHVQAYWTKDAVFIPTYDGMAGPMLLKAHTLHMEESQ